MYFINFDRFISGIGRLKVLISISCRFSLDILMKTSETIFKRGNSQLFDDTYNKSRNNLFGLLYHLKKLERCVAQGRPKRIIISAPRHPLFEKQLVAGK